MSDLKIIGIVLLRNEDVYVEYAIRNILEFCDKIIIADHRSLDRTFEICQSLAREFPKIDLRRISNLAESSEAIAPYYGTRTWIFAVDGDEIFDPAGLKQMRERLLTGDFERSWTIFPNTLNCVKLDLNAKQAWGYLAPPSRSGARLFNFSAINGWTGATGERLHGDGILFKEGFHAGLRRYLHQEMTWEASYFRYVHASFLKRSSLDKTGWIKTRLNPDELQHIESAQGFFKKMIVTFRIRLDQWIGRDWKNRKYKRGPLVEKDVKGFFSGTAINSAQDGAHG